MSRSHTQSQTDSPLQTALACWAGRDGMGGFASAAAALFPGWVPKASCRAPHREDRSPSFSLYRGTRGVWRFKDHATGEGGGLVAFVMLAGMDAGAASRWLIEATGANDEIRMTNDERMTKPEARMKPTALHSDFGHSGLFRHSVIRHSSFTPYRLGDTELARCSAMASALYHDPAAIARIASARGWQPGTIRDLALEHCLGLHDGHPVMIYPTGAKKRLKPLALPDESAGADSKNDTQGPKFLWMFGKPDALWRGDRLLACTERVHLTEGETAAITLIDDGLCDDLTTIVLAVPGASGWREEWAGAFHGRHVTLWPDADAAGARLHQRMIASLTPFVKSIETVTTSWK